MAYEGNPNWPAIFSTGHVTGTYVDSNGVPLAGKQVTFQPRPPRLNATNDATIVISAPTVVTLDSTGSFTVELPATDDAAISPVRWTYEVTENWSGGQAYDISVPSGVTSNLLDLAPVQDSLGVMRYIGPTGPSGATDLPSPGNYTYDSTGRVVLDPDGFVYTYNSDSTIATVSRGGVTRTATYGPNGIMSWA